MIDIESVEFRNFLSYGDYPTTLPVSNLGQCFINGQISDYDDGSKRSNGAGKSSLTQAILWCLSGKTMYDKNPGDGVRNWFVEADTQVIIKLKDGSVINRIRSSGETTLIFHRAGRELIHSTLSTSKNQQSELNRLLKFDFEIFCGSVFSSQYKKDWMQMGDQSRKNILERVMGIDRLSVYADVAKKKKNQVEQEQEKIKAKIGGMETGISSLIDQLDLTKEEVDKFEQNRAVKRQNKLNEVPKYQQQLTAFQRVEIEGLRSKWDLIDKIQKKISEMEEQVKDIRTKINESKEEASLKMADIKRQMGDFCDSQNNTLKELDITRDGAIQEADDEYSKSMAKINGSHQKDYRDITTEKSRIESSIATAKGSIEERKNTKRLWLDKDGKVCLECEQDIPHDHVESKIGPLDKEIKQFEDTSFKLGKQRDKIDKQYVALDERTAQAIDSLEATITADKNSVWKKYRENSDHIRNETQETVDVAKSKCDVIEKQCKDYIDEETIKQTNLEEQIITTNRKVDASKPEMTVGEAEAHNARYQTVVDTINLLENEAAGFLKEINPFIDTIPKIEGSIAGYREEINKLDKQLEQYDQIYKHYHYIYKAYSDRRKVKSYLISKHRPYFNNRLHYYLDLFDLDLKISITESLGISSNMWKPQFQCGGERARTDLAFTFSVFDLHQGIHGKQCNVLVLDEPDDGLDEAGVEFLINIIKNEFGPRFETILVVSHKQSFKDMFPNEIMVERIDRFSHLLDVR